MKIFIWQYIENLSSNYDLPSGGGLVVFAENESRARELANTGATRLLPEEKPDLIAECVDGLEKVFRFNDGP